MHVTSLAFSSMIKPFNFSFQDQIDEILDKQLVVKNQLHSSRPKSSCLSRHAEHLQLWCSIVITVIVIVTLSRYWHIFFFTTPEMVSWVPQNVFFWRKASFHPFFFVSSPPGHAKRHDTDDQSEPGEIPHVRIALVLRGCVDFQIWTISGDFVSYISRFFKSPAEIWTDSWSREVGRGEVPSDLRRWRSPPEITPFTSFTSFTSSMLQHFLRWPPSEGWQRNLETRENSQVLMFSIRFTWMQIGGLEVHAKCRAAGRCTGCNQGLPLVQHHEAKRSEQKDVNTRSWVIGDQCLRGHKRTQQFRPFWQGISAMICHDVPQVWKKTKRTTYKHTPAHLGKHQWTRHHQICYRLLSAGSGWKKVLPNPNPTSTTSTTSTHQHTIPHPSCHEAIPVQISGFQHSNSPKYAEMKRND